MTLKKLSCLALAVTLLASCQTKKPDTGVSAAVAVEPVLQDTAG